MTKRMGATVHPFKTTFCEAGTQLSYKQIVGEVFEMQGGINPLKGLGEFTGVRGEGEGLGDCCDWAKRTLSRN